MEFMDFVQLWKLFVKKTETNFQNGSHRCLSCFINIILI